MSSKRTCGRGIRLAATFLLGLVMLGTAPAVSGQAVVGNYPSVPLPPSPYSTPPPIYSPFPPPSIPSVPPPVSPTPPPSYQPSPSPPTYSSTPPPPPTPPSPTPTPSPTPSPSPSPSPSPTPSPSPSPSTGITISGSALFVGPAASCTGEAGGDQSGDVATNSRGDLSGTGSPDDGSKGLILSLGPGGSACADAFTALALPFALAAPWVAPAPGSTPAVQVVVTPTTRLLAYSRNTGSVSGVAAAYALVGVDARGAESGALVALKQPTIDIRRKGSLMALADTALASLVVTASATLAPHTSYSSSSSFSCRNAEDRADAVYTTLAQRIASSASGSLDLNAVRLCEAVVTASAAACGVSDRVPDTVAAQACGVYEAAVGSVTADGGASAVVPFQTLALAARVVYVVQTAGVQAVEALGGNAQAVQQLVAEWPTKLAAARINTDAIADALGMTPLGAATGLGLSVRTAGQLAQCPVTYRQVSDPTDPKAATTDGKGAASLPAVVMGEAVAASGCRDAALSVGNKTVRSHVPLHALLPTATGTAAVDGVSTLASAVFLTAQSSAAPRAITAADYAATYNYFGIGLAGAPDALPLGTDFIRQNWPANNSLVARAYVLSLRVLAAVGPTGTFVSGLVKNTHPVEEVAASFMATLASDLLANRLQLEDQPYLAALMRTYYEAATAQASARRRLHATSYTVLDPAQLGKLLSLVSQAVGESSNMLVQLDRQVVSAATAGQPIDVSAVLLSAAKIAAVQQSSLTDLLAKMAAAAADNDAAALAALQNTLVSSFTGAGLVDSVRLAQVEQSGIGGGGGSGGGGGDVVVPRSHNSGLSGGAIAGIVIGSVFGGVLIALVVLLTVLQVRKRRAAQRVSQLGITEVTTLESPELPPPAAAGTAASGYDDPRVAMLDAQAAADAKGTYNSPERPMLMPNEAQPSPPQQERPASAASQRPGSANPSQPQQERPASAASQRPSSAGPSQPQQERPVSATPQRPDSAVPSQPQQERPASAASQRPSSAGPSQPQQERPASATPQRPDSAVPSQPEAERPASATPQLPGSTGPSQPEAERPASAASQQRPGSATGAPRPSGGVPVAESTEYGNGAEYSVFHIPRSRRATTGVVFAVPLPHVPESRSPMPSDGGAGFAAAAAAAAAAADRRRSEALLPVAGDGF